MAKETKAERAARWDAETVRDYELLGFLEDYEKARASRDGSTASRVAVIRKLQDAAEARVHDRWTREVQHRFDTCEARHVDEWRAFAVKMGVVLKP